MEGLVSTNKYNIPRVLQGKEEIVILLIRLIILEPGSNPLHPEMGVGLKSRWSNCAIEDLPDLSAEIKSQIIVYLPSYQQASVIVTSEDSIIRISVNIDDTLYQFTTSEQPAAEEISLAGLK